MDSRRWRLVAVVLLTVVLTISGVAAASATPVKLLLTNWNTFVDGVYGIERPIATGASPLDQHYPSIYGDYIVYESGVAAGNGDLMLFNRATGAAAPIAGTAGWQWRPRIWGTRVVWCDSRNGNWDVYWYDIKSGEEHRLTDESATQWWPEINGTKVVWEDNRHGNSDVYMYDFATGRETRITTSLSDQRVPRVSGNRVIYQDNRNGNWDIYWYDLSTKQEYRLTASLNDEMTPDVWGDKAAYSTNNGANLDVTFVTYFDKNGAVKVNPGSAGHQDRIRVYGNLFLWESTELGDSTVMYYLAGQSFYRRATSSAGNEYEPQMWGSTLAYFDTRSGNRDIYITEIMRPTLSMSAPTVVGFGKTTTVTGYLKRSDGSPLVGRTVKVGYVKAANLLTTSGNNWPTISATTNSAGKYTATIPVQTTRFMLRAWFDGADDAWWAWTDDKVVYPAVSLTKPTGKSTIANTKSYTYFGYLKPKQPAGSQRVWIKCYRKSGGKWRYKKTYATTIADYSAESSKYSKKIKLTTEGKWRIRAQFKKTGDNAETYSSWKYITVN